MVTTFHSVDVSSGLGIRSSVFRAICSFFVSERAKEQYAGEKEQIAHGRSFVKSSVSELLRVAL